METTAKATLGSLSNVKEELLAETRHSKESTGSACAKKKLFSSMVLKLALERVLQTSMWALLWQ